jgi:hypothetical protein
MEEPKLGHPNPTTMGFLIFLCVTWVLGFLAITFYSSMQYLSAYLASDRPDMVRRLAQAVLWPYVLARSVCRGFKKL